MATTIDKMSSDELKQAIYNTPGSNEPDDSEDVGYPIYESDSGELESGQKAESPEAYAKRMWQETKEEENQEAREREGEKQEQILNYLEKRVRASGSEDQFSKNFQDSQMEDYQDLRDKYFDSAPLVDIFGQEYVRGKVKVDPQTMQESDAPHEDLFLTWIGKPNIQKKYGVTIKDLANIIRAKAEGPALRSKSKELMFPHMMRPRKGGR